MAALTASSPSKQKVTLSDYPISIIYYLITYILITESSAMMIFFGSIYSSKSFSSCDFGKWLSSLISPCETRCFSLLPSESDSGISRTSFKLSSLKTYWILKFWLFPNFLLKLFLTCFGLRITYRILLGTTYFGWFKWLLSFLNPVKGQSQDELTSVSVFCIEGEVPTQTLGHLLAYV